MSNLKNAFHIEKFIHYKLFHHVYQPIINLQNMEVMGYEGLIRPNHTNNVDSLFQFAILSGKLFELDTASIHHALNATSHKSKSTWFVNVYPSTMQNPRFFDFLKSIHCFSNIVFEINETEKISDIQTFKKIIDQLKDSGYGIAVDDFGKGETSVEILKTLNPDFIKLDRCFSTGLAESKYNQRIIEELMNQHHATKFILEGIETLTELTMAKKIGIHYGQGYLLKYPIHIDQVN